MVRFVYSGFNYLPHYYILITDGHCLMGMFDERR